MTQGYQAEKRTVPDWLSQRASSTPDRFALAGGGERYTFTELNAAVDTAARRLLAAGVNRGDVVALLGSNGPGFAITVHAVARTGAVLLPLNLRLTSRELSFQLGDSTAKYLLYDASCSDLAAEAGADDVTLKRLSLAEITARRSASVRPDGEPADPAFDLDAIHSILYTSGTTGAPKGAILSYDNHLWSAIGSAMNLGVHEDDCWLACLPLFHVGGLAILLRSVIYGSGVIVHEAFDPARVNATIDGEGVTIVSVVADMLQRVLDERGERPFPGSLRCVLLGGGPAPEPLLQRCAELGVPVVQTYGLTECASQVATLSPQDALAKLGSAGKPLFGTELRIFDAGGRPVSPGGEGEIVVRGPAVTRGYVNQAGTTAAALRDGWFHTGDIGYLDEEGYLYVLDRRDDLIVSGGENVYPAEIEAVLLSHGAVLDAGVTGVSDQRWGHTPVAVVVLDRDGATSAAELREYCRQRLAAYKTPNRIEFAQSLPRNAAGKLSRSKLRSLLESQD